ncbi:uncharacterized protein BX664DRAFT_387486 [Halteromyces radiatus]|uniref:uncharacterized protein n=1 Tax=Halteromyces radiatus TaxID=101107 RepID=UPI002220F89A|nr:uncharacterized protein BX664DRAFT_387486 [Halteromyces radiatus]KAI8084802.1 hypothetical protein BX664DRAFT_387486 [Halteromyces radiatus]
MLFTTFLVLFVIVLIHVASASDINDCSVPDDIQPPKNVHYLHPSHIKVIASIGDSITAGVAAMNIDSEFVTEDDFKQYRGLSWLSGGDPGASSIANYIKHYSSDLFGSSTGVRQLPLCEKTFFCLTYPHEFEQDQLNAAIPSAVSNTIEEQVDYISKYIGVDSSQSQNWKLINIFIGTNDISVSCMPDYRAANYEKNIRAGLARLKEKVDHAVINIVGLVHTEQIIGLTDKQPGYRKYFQDQKTDPQLFECMCCRLPGLGKIDIGLHVDRFNKILQSVAKEYGPDGTLGSDSFTVVYQPFPLNIKSIPPTAISNLDGYHPNINAHRFFSKALWKELFLPKAKKYTTLDYKEDEDFYCPTATDRIRTD